MAVEKSKADFHFLVIDDDKESLKTVGEYLHTMGFPRVTLAENGQEALNRLSEDVSINFVISDWEMPLIDGITLLQKIRATSHLAHLPFMVITSPSSAEMEKIILASENMVDAYIVKPFRIKTFSEKLEEVIDKSVHGPQKKVVLADDDAMAREMIVEYLESIGFTDIETYENGEAAYGFIKDNYESIQLIISDWEMPKMSGIDLLGYCKANKNLKGIPFLMITSQASLERMKVIRAARSNVDHYLLKPFKADVFKARIEEVLDEKRLNGVVTEFYDKGKEYLEATHYKAAKESFEKVLKISPRHDKSLSGLGDVSLKTDKFEDAIPFYKAAIQADPYNESHHLKLAAVLERNQQHAQAIEVLKHALRYFSFSTDIHFKLGKIYFNSKQYELACKEFAMVTELDPGHMEAQVMFTKASDK